MDFSKKMFTENKQVQVSPQNKNSFYYTEFSIKYYTNKDITGQSICGSFKYLVMMKNKVPKKTIIDNLDDNF